MNATRRACVAAILLAETILTWGCSRRQQPADGKFGLGEPPRDVETWYGPPRDFTLTDQDGMTFELSSLRGKAVLIFFGYTACPDACPVTMSKIASVYRHLGPEASRLKTAYISVDTERDTPPVLKAYLTNFKSVDAVGLTGTVAQIDQVVALYGAQYLITPEPGTSASNPAHSVAHSTSVYLVDPQGRTRKIFDYDATVDQMTAGVQQALKLS